MKNFCVCARKIAGPRSSLRISVAEAVSLSDRIIVFSVYPGQIAHEIPIRFASLRNADLRLRAEHEQMLLQVTHNLPSVGPPPITRNSKMKLLAQQHLTDAPVS